MCLIIDANLASEIFAGDSNPDFLPVIRWLLSENGLMVYGGKNFDELKKINRATAFIRELNRLGRADIYQPSEIDEEENVVMKLKLMRSDDPHVIALARVSGARVVCTNDVALIADFKNVGLVPSPKGKIYRGRQHKALLGHCRGCRGYKKSKK